MRDLRTFVSSFVLILFLAAFGLAMSGCEAGGGKSPTGVIEGGSPFEILAAVFHDRDDDGEWDETPAEAQALCVSDQAMQDDPYIQALARCQQFLATKRLGDCDSTSPAARFTNHHAAALENPNGDFCMRDVDGDGYGDSNVLPPVDAGHDCVDVTWAVNPGAIEVVNGVDDNCDGMMMPGECASDADCGAGTCNVVTHTCESVVDLCAGVTCTASDACHGVGSCDPTTGACSNPAQPDGTSCADADLCDGSESCQAGACTDGLPVVCTASDACHGVGSCDPTTGACSNPVVPNCCLTDLTCPQFADPVFGVCTNNNTSGTTGTCTTATDADADGEFDLESNYCSDTFDNDGDGLIDCGDPSCAADAFCTGATPELCSGGVDEDLDSLVDCLDPDCAADVACVVVPPSELCSDGVDNDGNGQIDCADAACIGGSACDGTLGDRCVLDADCQAPLVCTNGTCQAIPPPSGCLSPADCASGEVCRLDGTCEAVATTTTCTAFNAPDVACQPGEVCQAGVCLSTASDGVGMAFTVGHSYVIGLGVATGQVGFREVRDLSWTPGVAQFFDGVIYVTWFSTSPLPNGKDWWDATVTDDERKAEIVRLGCECIHANGTRTACGFNRPPYAPVAICLP